MLSGSLRLRVPARDPVMTPRNNLLQSPGNGREEGATERLASEPGPKPVTGLSPRQLPPFATATAACSAMFEATQMSFGPDAPCAPFRVRTSCKTLQVPSSSMILVELRVVETVPTRHCENGPRAPRADLTSVYLAPASPRGQGIAVATESIVSGHSASTMQSGMQDGTVELVASALHDDARALLFRSCNEECWLDLVVCDRRTTWCTDAVAIADVKSKPIELRVARQANHWRIALGGAGSQELLFSVTAPEP